MEMETKMSSSLTLNNLNESLSPYLQEIISAKLKPNLLVLSQYSENPSIKQNWISRFPVEEQYVIFYSNSNILAESQPIETDCVIFPRRFIFSETFTRKILLELRRLCRMIRIKRANIVLEKSFECSLDDLQELFELTDARGLTIYGPSINKDILNVPAVLKMKEIFAEKINLNDTCLNRIGYAKSVMLEPFNLGDASRYIDIFLTRMLGKLESIRLRFSSRRCLSLEEKLFLISNHASGFIMPFMLTAQRENAVSNPIPIERIHQYRNCQTIFVNRRGDGDNLLIIFSDGEILIFSEPFMSVVIGLFS